MKIAKRLFKNDQGLLQMLSFGFTLAYIGWAVGDRFGDNSWIGLIFIIFSLIFGLIDTRNKINPLNSVNDAILTQKIAFVRYSNSDCVSP